MDSLPRFVNIHLGEGGGGGGGGGGQSINFVICMRWSRPHPLVQKHITILYTVDIVE